MDWDQMIKSYESYQKAAGLSDRTIHARTEVLKQLEKFVNKTPQKVHHEDLIDFINRPHKRTGHPLSQGTKQTLRSYLQVWGKWMSEEYPLFLNPAARLPRVKVPRRTARPLAITQVNTLLTANIHPRTQLMVALAANTGLRIGEIVKLRGEDYDPVSRQISVTRKGGFHQRIYIPDFLATLLFDLPRTGWWFPSPLKSHLFPDGGGHVLMKSASYAITRAMRKNGIIDRRLTGHSLRHFYACMLLEKGNGLEVVQKMMGHASLATTQIYIEVDDLKLHNAAQSLPVMLPRGIDFNLALSST